MSTAMIIYLVGVLDIINHIAGPLFLISTILMVVCWLITICVRCFDDMAKTDRQLGDIASKFLKPLIVIAITTCLIVVFSPSKRTIAAMIIIPPIIENESVQEIAGNGLEGLRKMSQEWVKDIGESK